jgi:anti-anti-sigma factor
MLTLLEQQHSAMVASATARLFGRATSAFRRLGEDTCRTHVDAVVVALRADLASGKRDAVRAVMQTLADQLASTSLTFADLRFFALTLRDVVRNAVQSQPAEGRLQVEDWFFELVLVCSMNFAIQREELLQKRSVKLELQQLESQLGELKTALTEKTHLLEVIRQASTPIAPVVEGILVVPLVGMFDAFRAELVTEKLLNEVSSARARAVILDITGVPVFDTDAAQLIIRLAHAVRLLGAELILVGMSPENARTIVDLGIDLSRFQTFATLQAGLAQALLRQRLRIVPIK